MMVEYLLDSNVFIQAKQISYPIDIFPSFWIWLSDYLGSNSFGSISLVREELCHGNDELVEWIKDQIKPSCFMNVDDIETQENYMKIAQYVSQDGQQYKPTAIADFLDKADSWLIAKAITSEVAL